MSDGAILSGLPARMTSGGANRFEATIVALAAYVPDVVGLTLAPEPGARFVYRPGQYVSVIMGDGASRSFSMAGFSDQGLIELHIRRRPGGLFSDRMLAWLKAGDRLLVEGPYGQIDWPQNGGAVVLMGTGTGLAPLKALIEYGLARDSTAPIHLYWGGRTPDDLYLSAHLRGLARDHMRFKFIPLLSRAHPAWTGRRGYVQDAVAEDFASLDTVTVYACGSPAMIEAARIRLGAHPGFHEDRFLADAFEPAESPPQSAAPTTLTVRVTHQGVERCIPAAGGSTLLAALRAAGVPIMSVCGGKASCGACKVSLPQLWLDRLAPPARTEQRLLANLEGVGRCDRLACQIGLDTQSDGLAISLDPEATAAWPRDLP